MLTLNVFNILGRGKIKAIRSYRVGPKADKQLVHKPEEATLETIRGYEICSDGGCQW